MYINMETEIHKTLVPNFRDHQSGRGWVWKDGGGGVPFCLPHI